MSANQGAFTGFIDRARVRPTVDGVSLDLLGWFWAEQSPVAELYFAVDGGELRTAIAHDRPDVALRLPNSAHSLRTGFSVVIPVSERRPSYDVRLIAKLVSGDELSSSLVATITDEFVSNEPGASIQFGSQEARQSLDRHLRIQLESFLRVRGDLVFPKVTDPLVSVIIPVHGKARFTLACLLALRAQSLAELEVIVVDNDSSDETEVLLSRIKGVRVIRNETNVHYGRASNMGAEVARGEMLLFLNNDAFVMPTAIFSAVNTLRSSPRIGTVGGKLLRPDGKLQELGSFVLPDGSTVARGRGTAPDSRSYVSSTVVDYCSGAFLLTWKELFLISGGFDDRFAPAYYEDVEYCVRIASKGRICVADAQAEVLHFERGSASSDQAVDSLIGRNRRTFLDLHPNWWRNERNSKARAPSPGIVPKVLFIDDAVADPARGQGLARAALIQSVLEEFSCEVELFVGANRPTGIGDDRALRLEVIRLGRDENEQEVLRGLLSRCHLAIVSRPHHMELVQALLRKIPVMEKRPVVVYDAEALQAKREILRTEVVDEMELSDQEIVGIVSTEIVLARDADTILAVSKQEADAFYDFGFPNVSVLGFGVEPEPSNRSFADRRSLVTIGPMLDSSTPNADGVRWFVEKVLPWIARIMPRDSVAFHAYGENYVDELRDIESDSFRLMGFVEDLAPVYDDYRIFIAPTRFSAGLPLKVIQAAAAGIPVVATPLVANQLGWRDEVELLVGYNEQDFAAKVSALYVNSDLWEMLREKALRRVTTQFSLSDFRTRAREVFRPYLDMRA